MRFEISCNYWLKLFFWNGKLFLAWNWWSNVRKITKCHVGFFSKHLTTFAHFKWLKQLSDVRVSLKYVSIFCKFVQLQVALRGYYAEIMNFFRIILLRLLRILLQYSWAMLKWNWLYKIFPRTVEGFLRKFLLPQIPNPHFIGLLYFNSYTTML